MKRSRVLAASAQIARFVFVVIARCVLLPLRLAFGHDFFISYSRQGGGDYAGTLTEALERSYHVRIDKQETKSGIATSLSLRWAIIRSRVLVVVGTPSAIASTHVLDEVRLFNRWGGASTQVIAAQADDVVSEAEFHGLPLIIEPHLSSRESRPSEATLRQLRQGVEYWKVSRRQAAISALLGCIFVGLLAASYVAARGASQARAGETQARADEQTALNASNAAKAEAATLGERVTTLTGDVAKAEQNVEAKTRLAEAADRRYTGVSRQLEQRTQELQRTSSRLASQQHDLETAAANLTEQKQQTALALEEQKRVEALRRTAVSEAMTASVARVRDSLGSLAALRTALSGFFERFALWQSDVAAFPEEVSLALPEAILAARKLGVPFGSDRLAFSDFDIGAGGHLLVAASPKTFLGSFRGKSFVSLWDVPSGTPLGTLVSEEDDIEAVAVSGDSRTVAVCYGNGDLKLVSLPSLTTRQIRLARSCAAVRFTASGRDMLATSAGTMGESVFRINVATGEAHETRTDEFGQVVLPVADRSLSGLAVAPDVFGVLDSKLVLTTVDVATGARQTFDLREPNLQTQVGRLSWSDPIALSPDGRWVAVSPPWDVAKFGTLIDLACARERRGQCRIVTRLPEEDPRGHRLEIGFAPDSNVLVFGESPSRLRLYRPKAIDEELSAPSGTDLLDVGGVFAIVDFARVSPEVVVATRVEGVETLASVRLDSAPNHPEMVMHPCQWRDCQFKGTRGAHADGTLIALTDERLMAWDKRPLPGVPFVQGLSSFGALGTAREMAVSPRSQWIATAHANGNVVLWHAQQRRLTRVIRDFAGQECLLGWADDGEEERLYIASRDGRVSMWSASHGMVALTTPRQFQPVTQLLVARRGESLLLADATGQLAIFHRGAWSTLKAEKDDTIALSRAGDVVAILRPNGTGRLISVEQPARAVALQPPKRVSKLVGAAHFALSDSRLVAIDDLDGLLVWDARTGGTIETVWPSTVPAAAPAVLPSERTWIAYRYGYQNVVDLANGEVVASVSPLGRGRGGDLPRDAYFDVDGTGTRAASSPAGGGELLLWDIRTGRRIASVPTSHIGINRLRFIGQQLAVVDDEGLPHLMALEVEPQLKQLCSAMWTDSTLAERIQKFDAFCPVSIPVLSPITASDVGR